MIIMRKLLTLVLILAMASMASAAAVDFYANGVKDLTDCVMPDQAVTITVQADFAVIGLQMATTADGGTAQAAGALDAGFDFLNIPGTLRNSAGTGTLFILIDKITGAVNVTGGSAPIAAGTDLYTFTWVAPAAQGTYTIGATPNGYTNPWFPPPPPAYTVQADGSQGELVNQFNPCTVCVVPEPMTIALLGLGGLFLRRRLA
jgi:hypothetical protein